MRIDKFVLQRLREHAPFTPAPYFATRGIKHHKVVRLSVGESQLDTLAGVVADLELSAALTVLSTTALSPLAAASEVGERNPSAIATAKAVRIVMKIFRCITLGSKA
jgi:hypothetical protein